MKCSAVDIPNLIPGWGCCKCRTYNGNQREACKACGHVRCDNPAVKQVPIREDGGVRIIPVHTDKGMLN